jgi:hypothetical protein
MTDFCGCFFCKKSSINLIAEELLGRKKGYNKDSLKQLQATVF